MPEDCRSHPPQSKGASDLTYIGPPVALPQSGVKIRVHSAILPTVFTFTLHLVKVENGYQFRPAFNMGIQNTQLNQDTMTVDASNNHSFSPHTPSPHAIYRRNSRRPPHLCAHSYEHLRKPAADSRPRSLDRRSSVVVFSTWGCHTLQRSLTILCCVFE
jgi:hypothetical protein